MQHQPHGFGDGHEVPDDLRVGDRQRPAAGDLFLEARDDRAVRAQHVAEAHGLVADLLGGYVERLAIGFGRPLRRAHDVGRIDRLVGRDHHAGRRAGRQRRIGDVAGAEQVGLDRLQRIRLDQRHVLQRRGMEDDVRLELLEHQIDARAVAHVDDAGFDAHRFEFLAQLHVERIEVELRAVGDDQPARRQQRDLPAQFRTDRAAGAGHQHRALVDQAGDALDVGHRPPAGRADRRARLPSARRSNCWSVARFRSGRESSTPSARGWSPSPRYDRAAGGPATSRSRQARRP